MPMNAGDQLGKALLVMGAVLMTIGGLLLLGSRLPWLRIGRLPGDVAVQREGFSFYFPIATMVFLSLLLTLILWIVRAVQR
jgi:hypothetical protein